ncbi:hypothetical protein M5K25_011176 [Dendrobium thyrsiflorum]|uniref:Uncharacterized protein n=1 Tax=Dendrobium thyrsiflorum TaxID=117978 RepID=A0ABD0V359_DENTH
MAVAIPIHGITIQGLAVRSDSAETYARHAYSMQQPRAARTATAKAVQQNMTSVFKRLSHPEESAIKRSRWKGKKIWRPRPLERSLLEKKVIVGVTSTAAYQRSAFEKNRRQWVSKENVRITDIYNSRHFGESSKKSYCQPTSFSQRKVNFYRAIIKELSETHLELEIFWKRRSEIQVQEKDDDEDTMEVEVVYMVGHGDEPPPSSGYRQSNEIDPEEIKLWTLEDMRIDKEKQSTSKDDKGKQYTNPQLQPKLVLGGNDKSQIFRDGGQHLKPRTGDHIISLKEKMNKEYFFKRESVAKLFKQALNAGLELPKCRRPEKPDQNDNPSYCPYHRVRSHPIEDSYVFKDWLEKNIEMVNLRYQIAFSSPKKGICKVYPEVGEAFPYFGVDSSNLERNQKSTNAESKNRIAIMEIDGKLKRRGNKHLYGSSLEESALLRMPEDLNSDCENSQIQLKHY